MKGSTNVSSQTFEILPQAATSFTFDLMNFNSEKLIDEVYAGELISNGPAWLLGMGGPTYFLWDKFKNLATNHEGNFIWTLTFYGPGCLPCQNQVLTGNGDQGAADCSFTTGGKNRMNGVNLSLSTCSDIISPINGKMQISVSAPTLVKKGYDFKFNATLKSWNFLENHLF